MCIREFSFASPATLSSFLLHIFAKSSIYSFLFKRVFFSNLAAGVKECLKQVQQSVCLRRSEEGVNLKISKMYFRKSIFVPPENMKIEHYRSLWELRGSDDKPPPVTRYVLRVGDVRIVDELRDSNARHLLYVPSGTRTFRNRQCVEALRFSVLLWPSHRSSDLEAEAKASIQPFNIVLDQVMLNFLRGHHESLNKLSEFSFERLKQYVSLLHRPIVDSSECESEAADTFSDDGDQPIFIKKFIFSPKLSVHFDYRGHQLDMSKVNIKNSLLTHANLFVLLMCVRISGCRGWPAGDVPSIKKCRVGPAEQSISKRLSWSV